MENKILYNKWIYFILTVFNCPVIRSYSEL